MNLSYWAYKHRPLVLLLTGLLIVLGSYNYFTLSAQEDPNILVREVVITTAAPGYNPEKVELLVTKTLEEAIREIPEVRQIRSTSRQGQSIVHAEVYPYMFELDQIWDDLREKVEIAANSLPSGVAQPVINDDFGDVAVMTIALTADGFGFGDMQDKAQHVRDRIFGLPGTKKIELHGVQEERIYLETNSSRLAQYGLSREAIVNQLQGQNTILPGGIVDTGERVFLVQPSGNFDTVEDVESFLIALPDNSGVVSMGDIAKVTRGVLDPPQRKAYFNGRPAIILAVAMLDGYRVLDYADVLRRRVQQIEQTLPVGYRLEIVADQSEQVAKAVYGVSANVAQTLAIVLGVVIVFLGLRTGLIVGAIIPSVMAITLAVMGLVDMPLERMSLATLIIALGLLVDNGIVIAEDFRRRLEEGEDRLSALKNCGANLALPLLASTATTVLVFLPLMLAEHEAGEYTRAISIIILITLSTSWLLAMLVTPLMCFWFMKLNPQQAKQTGFARLENSYGRILVWMLRHRKIVLLMIIVCFVVGVFGVATTPKKFFPASDRPQVLITLELAPDITLSSTDSTVVQSFIDLNNREQFPYIKNFATYMGYGGPRFVLSLSPIDDAPNKAFIVVALDQLSSMPQALTDLRQYFLANFPSVNAKVTDMFLGPSDPGVFEFQVKGPDPDVLYATAEKMQASLRDMPGMIDVYSDWEGRINSFSVQVDQDKARRLGVSSLTIAQALASFYSGVSISEFREGDDVFAIVFRAVESERRSLELLKSIPVQASSGKTVFLDQLATIELTADYAVIQREDLTRAVTVQGRPTAKTPEDIAPDVDAIMQQLQQNMPPGHWLESEGIVNDSAEGKAALGANMPLCLAVVVLLLVAQFNDFRRPIIILMTIPLVVTGVALGLHLLRADFGFMVILGLLSLAGIIVNNAIVLIDRIDYETASGTPFMQAVVSASQRRLRPIVMTTITTVVGLLPLIVSVDPLFYGMAVTIAFGLAVGTLLTLGVVPVAYSFLMRNKA
ncbi:efflux RND transporter permease subunit [Halioxenophilus aromaticivorans]|uniref:Efflux RND transporter permease subunit n=1 Tax=Halioxenophilus aromaticivorans TaxID=1306992 RepID=A0AAV3UA69_9ALTE